MELFFLLRWFHYEFAISLCLQQTHWQGLQAVPPPTTEGVRKSLSPFESVEATGQNQIADWNAASTKTQELKEQTSRGKFSDLYTAT